MYCVVDLRWTVLLVVGFRIRGPRTPCHPSVKTEIVTRRLGATWNHLYAMKPCANKAHTCAAGGCYDGDRGSAGTASVDPAVRAAAR